MSWTCPCTAIQPDGARFCDRCGKPVQLSPVPRANPSTSDAWKLGAIAGVLIIGVIFGSLVAVAVFGGGGSTQATAQATQKPDPVSGFQQAFDASFKNSCRQSAMRSGHVSQAVADNYCDCALPIFKETHSMVKAVAGCKQYVMR
jgi:hypothetical protein